MSVSRPLVLASTSPYRRELMERLRLPFTAVNPQLDEGPVQRSATDPVAMVRQLAEAKARAADVEPGALVIGSDQCAALGGTILNKPGTRANAEAQLAQLAGHTHDLWTAVCLLDTGTGAAETRVAHHRMTMRALTAAEISRYVREDEPEQCAGSYKVESLGIALFERIDGDDFTAIMGLPLMATCAMLRAAGVAIP